MTDETLAQESSKWEPEETILFVIDNNDRQEYGIFLMYSSNTNFPLTIRSGRTTVSLRASEIKTVDVITVDEAIRRLNWTIHNTEMGMQDEPSNVRRIGPRHRARA